MSINPAVNRSSKLKSHGPSDAAPISDRFVVGYAYRARSSSILSEIAEFWNCETRGKDAVLGYECLTFFATLKRRTYSVTVPTDEASRTFILPAPSSGTDT
jgi:hypothetical protein